MLLDIYSTKQSYFEEYESFCYQNCIRQILEYYKINNAGFYINTSLSLILKKEEENEYSIFFDEHARSVLPNYKDKVNRYYPESKDKYEVWEDNLEKIKNGLPIINGVDSYYLEYSPYYNSSHGIHTVILAGFSEIKDEVHVVDWFAPWFYKGCVDFNNYILARDSKNINDGGIFSGYPIKNNWAEIDNEGWNTGSLELISLNIKLSIEQYYINYKNEENLLKGIYALKGLARIIENIKSLDSDSMKIQLKKLYYSLYGTVRRKILFKLFLDNAYNETHIQKFNDTKQLLLKVIGEWEELLNVIMKGIFRCRDETIVKIHLKLVNLIKQEEELYEHLNQLKSILQ